MADDRFTADAYGNVYDDGKMIASVEVDYLPFVLTALNTQAEANADLPL